MRLIGDFLELLPSLDPNHVLSKLLPEARRVSYHLRPIARGFQLPLRTIETLFLASASQTLYTNFVLAARWHSLYPCMERRRNRFTCNHFASLLRFVSSEYLY